MVEMKRKNNFRNLLKQLTTVVVTCRYSGLMALIAVGILFQTAPAAAQESLFRQAGVPENQSLPAHVIAARPVLINRRAWQSPSLTIDLFGDVVTAVRDRIERHSQGYQVWVGHLQGNPADAVVITMRGNIFSGLIQQGADTYELGLGRDGRNRLFKLDLTKLPPDDAGDLPQGGGATGGDTTTTAADNTVQDLLVAYTQNACDYYTTCAQLEANIVTAVADINTAYAASGITITMNLVGTVLTNYVEPGFSQALSDLRNTTDGNMDELHPLRDTLGADLVALVAYNGSDCGIGYLTSSASTAFTVTSTHCLVGNRTLAHELGHNQGGHHDRITAGAGSSTSYNYGYRRCNNASLADNNVAPHFRTIMSYSCTSAGRVGRFSNPNVNYSGVPQRIDPAVEPTNGSWNAKILNDRAATVAGFRTSVPTTPPDAPTIVSATATSPSNISIVWLDNSDNETSFVLQTSDDGVGNWSTIATLPANDTNYSHDGLNPSTQYFYRLRAENSAGVSAWTLVKDATTDPLPPEVDDLAIGENSVKGSFTGNYVSTHASDGTLETITETHAGGPKKNRKQSYEHHWTFDVTGGAGGVVVTVDAWVSGSEGANFYYSLDGGSTRILMLTVDATASGDIKTFA